MYRSLEAPAFNIQYSSFLVDCLSDISNKMPHDHHHDCGHESHHDHEHDTSDLGPQDNLYIHIDRPNVVALNALGEGSLLIKPWHERLDESKVCILHVVINHS